jgi:hypothetical protein
VPSPGEFFHNFLRGKGSDHKQLGSWPIEHDAA